MEFYIPLFFYIDFLAGTIDYMKNKEELWQ